MAKFGTKTRKDIVYAKQPVRYAIRYNRGKFPYILMLQIEGDNCTLISTKDTRSMKAMKAIVHYQGELEVFCDNNKGIIKDRSVGYSELDEEAAILHFFHNKLK